MLTFAILRNNVVENVIVANDIETAEAVTGLKAVEYTEENPACIGDSFDPINNVFISKEKPVIEEPIE